MLAGAPFTGISGSFIGQPPVLRRTLDRKSLSSGVFIQAEVLWQRLEKQGSFRSLAFVQIIGYVLGTIVLWKTLEHRIVLARL